MSAGNDSADPSSPGPARRYNGAASRAMLNLPNTLSVVRIVLVPLLVVVMLTPPRSWDWTGVQSDFLGALIFGLASLTDLLDGWLARRRRQITVVGQWLDPLADKLLVLGALISLVQLERAPAWMVTIIVGRELAVTGLRSVATARGVAMPASELGKRKMAAQVTAILGLLLAPSVPFPLNWVGTIALWVMLALALWSAYDYYRRFSDVLDGRMRSGVDVRAGLTARLACYGGLASHRRLGRRARRDDRAAGGGCRGRGRGGRGARRPGVRSGCLQACPASARTASPGRAP